jgi:hypothetical protein
MFLSRTIKKAAYCKAIAALAKRISSFARNSVAPIQNDFVINNILFTRTRFAGVMKALRNPNP